MNGARPAVLNDVAALEALRDRWARARVANTKRAETRRMDEMLGKLEKSR